MKAEATEPNARAEATRKETKEQARKERRRKNLVIATRLSEEESADGKEKKKNWTMKI